MDFARVLETLAGFLAKDGASYAVIGGLALHAYGLDRFTQDIDLVVDHGVQPRLVAFLESAGYETLHLSPGYSNNLHPDPAMGRVDLVYVRGETSVQLLGGRTSQILLGGLRIPVPRPEHLIAMKLAAMKYDPGRIFRDLADIEFLFGLPEVDRAEVRRVFAKYGLLERYDELARRR